MDEGWIGWGVGERKLGQCADVQLEEICFGVATTLME